MRKVPLTVEEHMNLGKELKALRHSAIAVQIRLGRAYPYSGRVACRAERLVFAIEMLQDRMDEAAHQERPAEFQTGWYYGLDRDEPLLAQAGENRGDGA